MMNIWYWRNSLGLETNKPYYDAAHWEYEDYIGEDLCTSSELEDAEEYYIELNKEHAALMELDDVEDFLISVIAKLETYPSY